LAIYYEVLSFYRKEGKLFVRLWIDRRENKRFGKQRGDSDLMEFNTSWPLVGWLLDYLGPFPFFGRGGEAKTELGGGSRKS